MERPKGLKKLHGGSCILGRPVRDNIRAKGASVRESHKDLGRKSQLLGRAPSRAAVPDLPNANGPLIPFLLLR